MNYEQISRELRNNLSVIAEIERIHAETLGRHAGIVREHNQYLGELGSYRQRIDQNLAEITEKLDRLLGHKDGSRPAEPS